MLYTVFAVLLLLLVLIVTVMVKHERGTLEDHRFKLIVCIAGAMIIIIGEGALVVMYIQGYGLYSRLCYAVLLSLFP